MTKWLVNYEPAGYHRSSAVECSNPVEAQLRQASAVEALGSFVDADQMLIKC